MSAILRLSTMQFDDAVDLEMGEELVDGTSALPLIAYEMMLPLVDNGEWTSGGTVEGEESMPVLFRILSQSTPERAPARIAG